MTQTVIKIIGAMLLTMVFPESEAQISIVPKPAEIRMLSVTDSFVLSPQTTVFVKDSRLQTSVDFLNEYINRLFGFSVKKGKRPVDKNFISLNVDSTISNVQGAYAVDVNKNGISITGADESGVFYAVQTLIHLLPVDNYKPHHSSGSGPNSKLHIPLVSILDHPRFNYRGMHLDVGRHLFPVSFIKKYIDYLALHKINYFHWHLTEDQGWRIEIKKYPRLTIIGGYRNGTIIGKNPGTGNDNTRYGGYYSQDEIREIVAYAAKRYITVIPEIEMPGHSSAAIAAYPWLSCFPDRPTNMKKSTPAQGGYQAVKKVTEGWGVFEDVYCAGNDSTFMFLQDVMDEVLVLFPSEYIHIGGDECPKTHWKQCSKCQKRIKNEGLKDEHELQRYFIQRMEQYLNAKGRKIIGWDEILEGGLAPNAIVMSWRGEKGGIEAVRQKHDVIMTPNAYLYFDQYQAKASEEPLAIGGYNPLSKVYSYDPVPKELIPEEAKYIKGVQANLWTEYVKTPEHVEYMLLPRIAALSETAWSQPEQKNWNDFTQRMEKRFLLYDALGINYSKGVYDVQQTILIESVLSRATVTLSTESYGTEIRYTLDGTEPVINSLLYSKPFVVRESVSIKAATFKKGYKIGRTSVQKIYVSQP